MNREGPLLAAMTHRLAECPEDFLIVAEGEGAVERVTALVADFFRRYGADNPVRVDEPFFDRLQNDKFPAAMTRHLGLICVAVWLFYDPWFVKKTDLGNSIWKLLSSNNFKTISRLLQPRLAVSDPDRREELVRVCLNGLGLRPEGESEAQATDRLMSLNSVERQRILKETAAAEKRAREVREAMAKAKALESVSRYSE